ncbi:hypothetical protein [Colwellia sp. MEBiC06753]
MASVKTQHQLSFARINIIADDIAEVIVNSHTIISLEMVEEYEQFLAEHFDDGFGLIINRINPYDYSFEAKLTIGSHPKLLALAVVVYDDVAKRSTQGVEKVRYMDDWNIKTFSGLELGWQAGKEWIEQQLLIKSKLSE